MTKIKTIKRGVYWIDDKDRKVHQSLVPKTDKLKDKTVNRLCNKAIIIEQSLKDFKSLCLKLVDEYFEAVEKEYNTSEKTAKGNKILYNFNKNAKVEIRVRQYLNFDEKASTAKSLIDKCITKWGKDSNKNFVLLVGDTFSTDKPGKLNKSQIFRLLKYGKQIKDEDLQKALKILQDSMYFQESLTYVKLMIKEGGKWKAINLKF